MWWVIGGVILLVLVVFMSMFNRGADVKRKGGYLNMLEDEEQIKAVSKIGQNEKRDEHS